MSTVPNAIIVAAAITALAPFYPRDRQQVADLLLFWIRRGELTPVDITAVQDQMFPEPATDGREGYANGYIDGLAAAKQLFGKATPVEQPACPDWCTLTHDPEDDARDDLALHMGDDHTDETARKLLDAHTLEVRVARTDVLSEGRTGTPNLFVRVDAELTTWQQAAELARTILDAFGYVPAGAE
jgi:hypothetical protein